MIHSRKVATEHQPPAVAAIHHIDCFEEQGNYDTALDTLLQSMRTDKDWVALHTRLLVLAQEWNDYEKDPNRLLRGTVLQAVEEKVVSMGDHPNPALISIQNQFLIRSRQAADKARKKQLAGVSSALLGSIFAGLVIFNLYSTAESRRVAGLSRTLSAESLNARDARFDKSVLLAKAALDVTPKNTNAVRGLMNILNHKPGLLHFIWGDSSPIQSVALSPSGTLMATGHQDGTIRFISKAPGKSPTPSAAIPAHQGPVLSLVFSPNGKLLATGGEDGDVRLWNTKDRDTVKEPLNTDSGGVNALAFSPDGELLATGGADTSVGLWRVSDLRPPFEEPLLSHDEEVRTIAFSPDGRWLASSGWDEGGRVALWEVASGQNRGLFTPGGEAEIIAFHPNNRWLAVGDWDNQITIWDVESQGAPVATMKGHQHELTGLAFAPSGDVLISAGKDNEIRRWSTTDWSPLGIPLRGQVSITQMSIDAQGRFLLTADESGAAAYWDLGRRHPLATPLGQQKRSGRALTVRQDGTPVSAGSGYSRYLWETSPPEMVPTPWPGGKGNSYAVDLSRNGEMIAWTVGNADADIMVWDGRSKGRLIGPLKGHSGIIHSLAFSPDGEWLASSGDNGEIRLWDLHQSSTYNLLLKGHESAVYKIIFSPDGKRLASGGEDTTVRIWDVAKRSPIGQPMQGHDRGVLALAFSANGQRLASGDIDDRILVWDLQVPGAPGISLTGHRSAVETLAFSPDGTKLASGEQSRNPQDKSAAVILWDLAEHEAITPPLVVHGNSVVDVAFSRDGRRVYSLDLDGELSVMPASPDGLQALACRIANRDLTPDEVREYDGLDKFIQPCSKILGDQPKGLASNF